MFDCHIHSNFSGDSELNPLLACDKAIQLGLEGIAFCDHLDIDYPNYDDTFTIDFDKYSSYMDDLKIKYKDKLKVLKGIEVGIQPHVIDDSLKIVENYDFDYVIGSIHIVDYLDLHNGDYCRNKSKTESYSGYFNEILKLIKEYKNYDILGHIDMIRRYGDYNNKNVKYLDYKNVLDEVLKTLISEGKGIEVNTSGYKYKLNSPLPDYEIIKRYKELGGEIICIGSDAHSTEYIGYNFPIINEILKKSGFKFTTYFVNRNPIFSQIK